MNNTTLTKGDRKNYPSTEELDRILLLHIAEALEVRKALTGTVLRKKKFYRCVKPCVVLLDVGYSMFLSELVGD